MSKIQAENDWNIDVTDTDESYSPERAAHEVVTAIDDMIEKCDLSPIELNTMHRARMIAILRAGL